MGNTGGGTGGGQQHHHRHHHHHHKEKAASPKNPWAKPAVATGAAAKLVGAKPGEKTRPRKTSPRAQATDSGHNSFGADNPFGRSGTLKTRSGIEVAAMSPMNQQEEGWPWVTPRAAVRTHAASPKPS